MALLLIFAFIAGIVTVLSPCILPVLPIILSSSLGDQQFSRSRPIGVVIGFIASFTFFTLFLSTIVQLLGISADSLRLFSIVVIIGFGLALIIPQFQHLLERMFSYFSQFVPQGQQKAGFFPGLLVGVSLGLLWTPCVGPILASVISLALTGSVTLSAFFITAAYALGTGIPMLMIMIGGQSALQKVPWLLRNTATIQKFFGIVMIATGIGIYFNVDRQFQTWILTTFPGYGTGLTSLEDNATVRNQLDQLNADMDEDAMGKSMFSMFEVLSDSGVAAPEIIPGGKWYNLPDNVDPETGLRLRDLRGKVVLIDFWTYSCINCQRTFPYLRDWWSKYQDQGFVIIGVHAPEFEFEKNPDNLAEAIEDFELKYPIVQDNNFATWRAYQNRFWPAKYVIDHNGDVRYTHFGEGKYDETERVIQQLLVEAGAVDVSERVSNPDYQNESKTPEIYLGYERLSTLSSPENVIPDEIQTFSLPASMPNNSLAFEGDWTITPEYAAPEAGSALELMFNAKHVFLVLRRSTEATGQLKIYLDGEEQIVPGTDSETILEVTKDNLYPLIQLDEPGEHILRLEFLDDNLEAYAFTFG